MMHISPELILIIIASAAFASSRKLSKLEKELKILKDGSHV